MRNHLSSAEERLPRQTVSKGCIFKLLLLLQNRHRQHLWQVDHLDECALWEVSLKVVGVHLDTIDVTARPKAHDKPVFAIAEIHVAILSKLQDGWTIWIPGS